MTALKSLIFLLVAPGLVAVYLPLAVFRNGPQIQTGGLAWLAFPLWLMGGVILLWSFWNFYHEGRGTPAPIDPPTELVAAGFYRYMRNPMYGGIFLILLGHFLWFKFISLIVYLVVVFVIVHSFVIFYEEPTLKRKFGEAYERYCERVPRWIPRMK